MTLSNTSEAEAIADVTSGSEGIMGNWPEKKLATALSRSSHVLLVICFRLTLLLPPLMPVLQWYMPSTQFAPPLGVQQVSGRGVH